MRVFIDPGHGGVDPGAVSPRTGYKEKDFNFNVAKLLELLCVLNGYEVELSREGDYDVIESKSAERANAWGADVYIAIHANSVEDQNANGFEVLYWRGKENSLKLAECVGAEFKNRLKIFKYRGVKERGGAGARGATVLSAPKMASVIVEVGFVSNETDETNLKDNFIQYSAAFLLLKAIEKYSSLPPI